jgi:HSP20 family molecular chaperone IbpA
VLQAVVPGVSKSDINVTVSERLVNIEVSRTRHDSEGAEKGPINEAQDVLTRRSFRLREDVEVDKSESRLENGILEVCLAKSAKSQPTKLKIMG